MVQAARKYGQVFQVGTQRCSSIQHRIGCALVRDGRIGKVHTVLAPNYPSPWECDFPSQRVPEGLVKGFPKVGQARCIAQQARSLRGEASHLRAWIVKEGEYQGRGGALVAQPAQRPRCFAASSRAGLTKLNHGRVNSAPVPHACKGACDVQPDLCRRIIQRPPQGWYRGFLAKHPQCCCGTNSDTCRPFWSPALKRANQRRNSSLIADLSHGASGVSSDQRVCLFVGEDLDQSRYRRPVCDPSQRLRSSLLNEPVIFSQPIY